MLAYFFYVKTVRKKASLVQKVIRVLFFLTANDHFTLSKSVKMSKRCI